MSVRNGRMALAWLAAATALAWASALRGTFQYDDWNIVAHNADVHGLAAWWASMPGIRPLAKASYAINWTLDPSAFGFVAFNVVCHAISAVLVWLLARRWIPALDQGLPHAGFAALTAALVFALHPAQTEAVTYVAGRSVSLSACLYLASLYAWERSRDPRTGRCAIAMSVLLFMTAVAARETAWTLPFAIGLLEIARGATPAQALRRLRWHGLALGAALLLILASPVYRRLLRTSFELRSPLDNLVVQVDAIRYLVTHPLLTLRLNIDPGLDARPFDLTWWMWVVMCAAAVVTAFMQVRRRPWLAFGLLWFFLLLLPTNGPIARFDLANDRQLYLAIIGPAMLLGIALAAIPQRRQRWVLATLAIVLGVATAVRNTDYWSEVALWEATVRVSPGKARVWNNLGYAHLQAGDRERARAAFEQALDIDAAHYKARQNLEDLQKR